MSAGREPHRPPTTPSSPRRLGWALAAAAALVLAAPAQPARAGAFDGVTRGFQARDAAAVVGAMGDGEGAMLELHLLTPSVSGTYRRAHAERTLTAYFEKVTECALKDVTPRDHRDAPGYRERRYEYRYRPREGDPQISLLTVTLQAGESGFELVALRERPKPR